MSFCLHWTPTSRPALRPKISTPACGWPLRPLLSAFGSLQSSLNKSRQSDSNWPGSFGACRRSESALIGNEEPWSLRRFRQRFRHPLRQVEGPHLLPDDLRMKERLGFDRHLLNSRLALRFNLNSSSPVSPFPPAAPPEPLLD